MGKNKKNVEVHTGEVCCCAVAVFLNPNLIFTTTATEELKALLSKIGDTLKKYNNLGVQPNPSVVFCLFRDNQEQNALDFVKDLESQNIDGITSIKYVKNACYVDERYLSGEYEGVQSTLPSREVDKAIKDILEKYCFEWKFETEPLKDMFTYIGELGGGREVFFIFQHGNKMVAGLQNSTARMTENIPAQYKMILTDLEKEIIEWSDNHKGISKIYNAGGEA